MDLHGLVSNARETQEFSGLIELLPYTKLIGIEVLTLGEELLFVLPPLEENIGNPTLPALHGGCIGGFLENAAVLHVLAKIATRRIPKVIDFSLDFLHPGRFRETYASCQVVRQGRNVVNVSVTAWQERQDKPISRARTHLLL